MGWADIGPGWVSCVRFDACLCSVNGCFASVLGLFWQGFLLGDIASALGWGFVRAGW